jgi:uncharacterized membrane protein
MSLVAVAATQAATVTAVSAVYLGQSITVVESYARVLGMLIRVILVMIGMGIGIGIGVILLVVPGIILGCMWALTIPVVVLENADLGDALSRSRQLTQGHRWRVFMIFILFTGLYYLAFFVIETPLIALVVTKGPESLRSIWSGVVVATLGQVATILMTPLMTIAFSVMYYDERVRKEAFDIQFLMSATPAQVQAETADLS